MSKLWKTFYERRQHPKIDSGVNTWQPRELCASVHACVQVSTHWIYDFVLSICKWVGYHPPPWSYHTSPSLPWREGSLKVEKLHKGRPHAAKPLIYSGLSLPLIIIAERKTEEYMTEYGVSPEKRVHTGVSSRCVLCNNIVPCIHSPETGRNMEFWFSATAQILENRNSGTFDEGNARQSFHCQWYVTSVTKEDYFSFRPVFIAWPTHLWRFWSWQDCWRSPRPDWKAVWPKVCSRLTSRPLFSWPTELDLESAKTAQQEKQLWGMYREYWYAS